MSEKIKELLDKANQLYRKGEPIMSDEEYDSLKEQVKDEAYQNKVGDDSPEARMFKLPIQMGSLNKIKDVSDIKSWCTSKNINIFEKMNITPKFDGLAILVELRKNGNYFAYTRGDGSEGQDITKKLPTGFRWKLSFYAERMKQHETLYLIGEIIMSKTKFFNKYSEEYKNPRNMVAGVVGRKTVMKDICDNLDVLIYDIKSDDPSFGYKTDVLDHANEHFNIFQIPYKTFEIRELIDNPSVMDDMKKSVTQYELDGVVICQNTLNRECETNSLNPVYSRAWKPQTIDFTPALVTGIEWETSKAGRVVPTITLSPVDVGGVTISRVTGYNDKFIRDNEIMVGTIVKLIRSGDVIPKVTGIVSPSEEMFLGTITSCPACKSTLEHSESGIDLICVNTLCSAQNFKSVVSFFTTLGIDDMGEGNIKTMFDAGYTTVESILKLSEHELENLPGFGTRKAKKIYNSINSKLDNIPLNVLQHASNLFPGLGSTKLKKLMMYDSKGLKPSKATVCLIEGFSDTSADVYVDNFDAFWDFAEKLPITIKSTEDVITGVLTGQKIVFTGFRDSKFEETIKENGGEVQDSLGKTTTILVMSTKGSGSSKEEKAKKLGIKIMDKNEFKTFLDSSTGLGSLL